MLVQASPTVIALGALIIVGRARLLRAPAMILLGAGYFVLRAMVIDWGESLAGVVMIGTGAVAFTFGAAIIGPRAIVTRSRQLSKRATEARRPNLRR